jgi:butyryl-CoA dehydrogenase
MSGQLPLLAAIKQLMEELMSPPSFGESDGNDDPLARETKMLANTKKLALFAAGAASQKYMNGLADQQEVMAALADIILEVYAFDSALSRARKLAAAKSSKAALAADMTRFYAAMAFHIIESAARQVIAAVAEGDMLRTQLAIYRRLVKHEPADTVSLSRTIARAAIEKGRYPL